MRFTALTMTVALIATAGCGGGDGTGPTTEDFNRERERVARAKKKEKPASRKKARKEAPAQAQSDLGLAFDGGQFVYDPRGLRDPFRSFAWERPDATIEEAELRGPLEQFDVPQLSLVAVVWDTGNAKALIEDPSGQSYIIGEGTRIGKNDGRVIRVGDNLVVVKETYVDFLGEETTKDVEMRIRRSEGG